VDAKTFPGEACPAGRLADVSNLALYSGGFFVSTRRSVLSFMFAFLAFAMAAPAYAQEAAATGAANSGLVQWSIITAGFALAIAAFGGALGQGRAVASATEAIARNPGAAGEIRGALILGLVLIESLVIYVLLVTLILFFILPFGTGA
jgi:F-type H+-transporting ATPase subunit c